jgi:tRNA(fMet)-specific endonuclease VapC
MNLYVLDTDMLTLYRYGHPLVRQQIISHPPNELAITVMSVEEELSGWYRLLRRAKQPPQLERVYQQLADSIPFLAEWQILSFPQAAIARCNSLLALKLNVRKMDLRIAAITLENGGILVTQNLRDFQRVPSLIIENWAA